ncbi:MAG: universal stress protein [Archangium sp.]
MAIVCATHFTQSSNDALHVAAMLAFRTKQKLWLCSVVPGVGSSEDDAVNAQLANEAGALREAGVQVETALLHGQLERSLGRLCHDVAAQLLVVGDTAHMRNGFFATPVDRIAEGVSVPTLVVKSVKPFEPWALGQQPLKVLLAIDHSWSSMLARNWITRLADYGSLDVVATHIWSPDEEAARHGKARPTTEAEQEALAADLYRDTEAALRGLPRNVRTTIHLELGKDNVGGVLMNLAEREKVDVMVLGTHPHRGLLGRLTSVTHEVINNGLMSIALVPDEAPSRLTDQGARAAASAQLRRR